MSGQVAMKSTFILALSLFASADAVATSLAAFLRRCATEIYPLYDLIGTLHSAGRAA